MSQAACDFDAVYDRGPDCQKWQRYGDADVIPMWLADMDFKSPPAVIAALHWRADHGFFGYALPTPDLLTTITTHLRRAYQWDVAPEALCWAPGLVCALHAVCRTFCAPGDAAMTCTPVYPPFLSAPGNMERELIRVPLALADGHWGFDFAAMERAVTPRTRLFILCHPHNPVGRVWRRGDLEQLADFCARHNLIICSDEIHCDLVLDDLPHVPIATLSPAVAARTITLMAPSKTYNLPGLGCSFVVIPNGELRRRFAKGARGVVSEVNALGYAACQAAYRDGEPWRQELLAYLRANRDFLETFVREQLPGITMTHVEATYLAWLDVRALKLPQPVAFFEAAGVGLGDGRGFDGEGYVRLTFGCPRALLAKGLERMRRALA